MSWMCKKQTSVSHSSTESEIISLDAGLRSDSIPALDLWDLIVLVLGNTTQNHDRTVKPVVCRCGKGAEEDAAGFAKTFPDITCVSQMLGGPSLRLGVPIKRLSIPPGIR